MVVASGTPPAIVERLGRELQLAIGNPEVRSKMLELGVEPTPSDAAAMKDYWNKQARYWPSLIRERQISLD